MIQTKFLALGLEKSLSKGCSTPLLTFRDPELDSRSLDSGSSCSSVQENLTLAKSHPCRPRESGGLYRLGEIILKKILFHLSLSMCRNPPPSGSHDQVKTHRPLSLDVSVRGAHLFSR